MMEAIANTNCVRAVMVFATSIFTSMVSSVFMALHPIYRPDRSGHETCICIALRQALAHYLPRIGFERRL